MKDEGRDMARWHLGYESVEPWPVAEHTAALALDPAKDFLVQKMTFGRKDKQVDKTAIIYNSHLTLTGIPLEAYDYVVNGKPAIEWIMERYQVSVDKDSGSRNDPNDWAREHGPAALHCGPAPAGGAGGHGDDEDRGDAAGAE